MRALPSVQLSTWQAWIGHYPAQLDTPLTLQWLTVQLGLCLIPFYKGLKKH